MVYSFEDGEKLTGIAFLDVNFYAMTMRAAQRFLVLGDVQKSVLFLGYQVSCDDSCVGMSDF